MPWPLIDKAATRGFVAYSEPVGPTEFRTYFVQL